jgi:hypothetical protein
MIALEHFVLIICSIPILYLKISIIEPRSGDIIIAAISLNRKTPQATATKSPLPEAVNRFQFI